MRPTWAIFSSVLKYLFPSQLPQSCPVQRVHVESNICRAAAVVVSWPAKLRVIVKSGQVITKSGETDIMGEGYPHGYPSITIISPDDSILLTRPKTPELGNSPLKFSDVQFIGWIGCLIKNYS